MQESETTKQEIIDSVEELLKLTRISPHFPQVRALRALAANLPENRAKLYKQVAEILEEQLKAGNFDNCWEGLVDAKEIIKEFVYNYTKRRLTMGVNTSETMNGYEEAEEIESIIRETLDRFPLKENAREWMNFTRTIHSSLSLLDDELRVCLAKLAGLN